MCTRLCRRVDRTLLVLNLNREGRLAAERLDWSMFAVKLDSLNVSSSFWISGHAVHLHSILVIKKC